MLLSMGYGAFREPQSLQFWTCVCSALQPRDSHHDPSNPEWVRGELWLSSYPVFLDTAQKICKMPEMRKKGIMPQIDCHCCKFELAHEVLHPVRLPLEIENMKIVAGQGRLRATATKNA